MTSSYIVQFVEGPSAVALSANQCGNQKNDLQEQMGCMLNLRLLLYVDSVSQYASHVSHVRQPRTLLTLLSFPGPTVSRIAWHTVWQGGTRTVFTPVKAEYLSPVHPNTLPHGVTPLHRRVEHRHLDTCRRRQRNEEKGPNNNPLSGGNEAPPACIKTRGAYSHP